MFLTSSCDHRLHCPQHLGIGSTRTMRVPDGGSSRLVCRARSCQLSSFSSTLPRAPSCRASPAGRSRPRLLGGRGARALCRGLPSFVGPLVGKAVPRRRETSRLHRSGPVPARRARDRARLGTLKGQVAGGGRGCRRGALSAGRSARGRGGRAPPGTPGAPGHGHPLSARQTPLLRPIGQRGRRRRHLQRAIGRLLPLRHQGIARRGRPPPDVQGPIRFEGRNVPLKGAIEAAPLTLKSGGPSTLSACASTWTYSSTY